MNPTEEGYPIGIEYVYGYQPEFNFLRQRLMCLASGLAIAPPKTACELGFGQGLSINIHAAASTIEWWGTDVNPTQASFARQTAEVASSEAKLSDQAFADFCIRSDLPDFDIIGLHGIWSWISDENRRVIVDFIKHRLNSGGILYISYNTLPGWGPFALVRQLLKEYDFSMNAPGLDALDRMDAAIRFVECFLDTKPLFLRTNPKLNEELKQVKKDDRRYLVHEYLHSNWKPMYIAEMASWLGSSRCSFACSADYIKDLDDLNLTAKQQEFLRGISDSIFRATIRDFAANERFRQDYWVKGPRRLSPRERDELLRAECVMLEVSPANIPDSIAGAHAKIATTFFEPIFEMLADYQPRSLGDIEQALAKSGTSFAEIIRAIMILVGAGYLGPVQDQQRVKETKARTDKLNANFIERARFGPEVSHLASPITGGGVNVPWIVQLFLLADRKGRKTPEDRVAFVWSVLQEHGRRVIKNGKEVNTDEANKEELKRQDEIFADQYLPLLRALGIAKEVG